MCSFNGNDRDRLARIEWKLDFLCKEFGKREKKVDERMNKLSGRVWGMLFIWVAILVGIFLKVGG